MAPTANSRRWGFRTLLGGCAIAIIAALVTASMQPARAGSASSPWPMLGHDARHSGLSPISTKANHGELKWTFYVGGGCLGSPVIGADGTIYAGCEDGVHAISPNGTEKWHLAGSQAQPAIGPDGTIYVDGSAINPDGTIKWHFLPVVSWPPVIGPDGTIYLASNGAIPRDDEEVLNAINPDGSQKWQFSSGIPGTTFGQTAVAADGTIYVGSLDESSAPPLYALNPDGGLKWKFSDPASDLGFGAPSVARDGTVYTGGGSQDGILYAIGHDGRLKWRIITPAQPVGSIGIGPDGAIYFGSSIFGGGASLDGANLYAINPNGQVKWRSDIGVPFNNSSGLAISADGTIYHGGDGNFYAINGDARVKWKLSTNSGDWSAPAIGADGTVYVGEDAGLDAVGSGPVAAILELFQTTLNFWAVKVGKSSVMTLGFGDRGGGALKGRVDVSGLKPPFAVVSGGGRFQIPHIGEEHAVNIKFAPRYIGSFAGTITITSNDPNNPSVTVTVRGSGK